MQFGHSLSGIGLEGVGQGDSADCLAVHTKEHYCLTFAPQTLSLFLEPVKRKTSILNQSEVAQEKLFAID